MSKVDFFVALLQTLVFIYTTRVQTSIVTFQ